MLVDFIKCLGYTLLISFVTSAADSERSVPFIRLFGDAVTVAQAYH